MGKKYVSPLAAFVTSIKEETKAERSASATLRKIIDDYSMSGKFDAYLAAHKDDLATYVSDQSLPRRSRFRASQVGKCLQETAFKIAGFPEHRTSSKRPARQYRALHNGTFMHLRYHLMFDAMHEAGLVTTLYSEDLVYLDALDLSGTVDRVVEFPYLGKTIRAVLDFKSIKAAYFDALIKPETPHAKQQHAYDLFDKYHADVWLMVYENKDTHELKLYDFPYSDLTKQQIIRELRMVSEFVAQVANGIPIEDRIKLPLVVTWCRYCPYDPSCLLQHPDLREQQEGIGEEVEDPIF
jgi:hypothetical protein